MGLQGVRGSLRFSRPLVIALLLAGPLALPGAEASAASSRVTTVTDPNAPVLVTSQNRPPAGYRLTAAQAERIAAANPKIVAEVHRHPSSRPYEYTKGPGRWQVSWFSPGPNGKELAQVYVDDASGTVTEAWTGFQVAWTMARGYSGAFGRRVNAWYVWVPLCLLFVAPFLPRRRPSLLHLDLLVLLGFSISLAFFNHGEIGISVPIVYPFLIYLLVRALLLAFGKSVPRQPLRLLVPASWLVVAIVFLVGFRVGLNVTNSNVIDVGYAGVIGADKLLHDKPLYGHFPQDNVHGDTYGPVNYYAYVPFRAVFGWSGTWDDLPAAHAAAIAFDLLTLLGLYFLGRRIRGPSTGIVLAYLWAAYPFTLYSLSSNSNDSLVAMLLVLALLVISSAPARGAAIVLAGMAKFAPFALAPLFLRGADSSWPRKRSIAAFIAAFAGTMAVVLLPVLLNGGLHTFWKQTVASQFDRTSPFSIWGLWGGLERRAASGPGIHGRPGDPGGVRAAAPHDRRGLGAGSGRPDRARARADPLVLPVHPVVLPAADRRGHRRFPVGDRPRAAVGRGVGHARGGAGRSGVAAQLGGALGRGLERACSRPET